MLFGVMRTQHEVSTRTDDDPVGLTDITVRVEEEFGQTEERYRKTCGTHSGLSFIRVNLLYVSVSIGLKDNSDRNRLVALNHNYSNHCQLIVIRFSCWTSSAIHTGFVLLEVIIP